MNAVQGNKKLSPEDIERVNAYLNIPVNQVERKPFRPFMLAGILLLVVTMLTVFSVWMAWRYDLL